jgi:hypothetical protein
MCSTLEGRPKDLIAYKAWFCRKIGRRRVMPTTLAVNIPFSGATQPSDCHHHLSLRQHCAFTSNNVLSCCSTGRLRLLLSNHPRKYLPPRTYLFQAAGLCEHHLRGAIHGADRLDLSHTLGNSHEVTPLNSNTPFDHQWGEIVLRQHEFLLVLRQA